jgi:hypothetical protein
MRLVNGFPAAWRQQPGSGVAYGVHGVDVAAGEDAPLILAITVAIGSLTTRRE